MLYIISIFIGFVCVTLFLFWKKMSLLMEVEKNVYAKPTELVS